VILVEVDIKELQLLPGDEVGLIVVKPRCTVSCTSTCPTQSTCSLTG
jgi:hypothetical protein